jgi:hypothetical protein
VLRAIVYLRSSYVQSEVDCRRGNTRLHRHPRLDPRLRGRRWRSLRHPRGHHHPRAGLRIRGWLTEVDDDSGRQLFVPTPLGRHQYLIKSYGKNDGHPANDEPACWQVYHEGSQPLTVQGAVCDATNPAQQFTITSQGKRVFAISNFSAYLQYSPNRGLILEELGDAPLLSTFRFTDNGPARTPAGG